MYAAALTVRRNRRYQVDIRLIIRKNLKRHLAARDWTIRGLAQRANIADTSVLRMVGRKDLPDDCDPDLFVHPTTTNLQSLADALGVPLWTLLVDGAPVEPVAAHRLDSIMRRLLKLDRRSLQTVEEIAEMASRHGDG